DVPFTMLMAQSGVEFDHTDCTLTFSKNGRVLTGTITANLGAFKGVVEGNETVALTNATFRVTLPEAGEEIRANLGGTIHKTSDEVTLVGYRPGRGISIAVQDTDADDAPAGLWYLVIPEMSGTAGQVNCGKNWAAYHHQTEDPTVIYKTESCTMNYTISDNLLTGTFSGTATNYLETDPFNRVTVNLTDGSFRIYLPDGPAGADFSD
ncbi:MAG TPA: hypothetical protein VL091_02735, partial [Marinobacter sp.]|nr:hypothetical protein [Marinobacter sp.]